MLDRLRSVRRAADRIAQFPAKARSALDDAIRAVEQSLGAADQVARIAGARATTIARIETVRRSVAG